MERKKAISCVWRAIPRGNKSGRGIKRRIMYTGDLAEYMNKSQYTKVTLVDLSDAQLAKLVQRLCYRR